MATPPHDQTTTEVSLDGFGPQDIAALKEIARDQGLSFDEGCSSALLERARKLRRAQQKSPISRLFSFFSKTKE